MNDNPIFLCQHCGNKCSHSVLGKKGETEIIRFNEKEEFSVYWGYWFVECQNCNRTSLFVCHEDIPEDATSLYPRERSVSTEVPEEIRIAYSEAKKVKKISKIAYVIMIRRSLELLCIKENATGRNLYQKINALGESNVIPPKLTDMADLIRLLGNEGAHDSSLEITDNEIDLLGEFFEAIIEYVYIAPEKVRKLREKLNN